MNTQAMVVRATAAQAETKLGSPGAGRVLLALAPRILAAVRHQLELSNQRWSLAPTSTSQTWGRETGCRC